MQNKLFPSLIALAMLLLGACAPAQPRPQSAGSRLPKEGLLADVDVLQRAYEALHPGLYRYNTPAQMRAHFAELRRKLGHDQSLADAYLAFSQFAAEVRCGHTYANFYNQPKAIQRALFENADRVPFYFRWLDGRMIVTRNFSSDPALVPGTQIVSIDGIATRSILRRLLTIARADGSNDAKRVAWLQVQGEDTYEAFDIFLPLLYPQIGTHLSLVVIAPDAARTPRTATVDALTYTERLAAKPEQTDGDGPLWKLDLSDPSVAVLRMPTWALYESKWNWKAFIDSMFRELAARRTSALVIDVRGNEGGMDVGDELLAHFIAEPLRQEAYVRLVRYRKVPDDLLPFLHTWDASFKDWGDFAAPFDDRFFRLTRFDDDASGVVINPAAPRYEGRIFVLIGATNSSATFEFANAMKTAKIGTLVGQPTGGNQRGINGGAFFFLRLPNSAIELDIPLIGQFPTGDRPDAGLAPDSLVTPSVADIATGRDAELDEVWSRLGARTH